MGGMESNRPDGGSLRHSGGGLQGKSPERGGGVLFSYGDPSKDEGECGRQTC